MRKRSTRPPAAFLPRRNARQSRSGVVDALAERVLSLGGVTVGDPRHAAELSSIPRRQDANSLLVPE